VKTYKRFIFESYDFSASERTIRLRYSLDSEIFFEERLLIGGSNPLNANHPDLDRALFALHLSGGPSYFKTYCPKTIEIKSGRLTKTQAEFWNTLYTYGLGEFFYRNKVDFRGLINFPFQRTDNPAPKLPTHTPEQALVPFGGGKDSIVTTEILRRAGVNQTLFRVRSHPLIDRLAGLEELPLVQVERTLPKALFDLNEAGALNGHVPITAHISFLSIVISLLLGFDSVFFSNERSSSYGNVAYRGIEVNHQWSKSNQFEQMLRDYIAASVTTDVAYLNVIRPLSELSVAKIFASLPQYFPAATSCNRNWTIAERDPDAPIWCGTCPKCAFSFALLSAYLPANTVEKIFGHNLFQDESLLPLFKELWGAEGFKPFECVGTPEEVQAALYLAGSRPGYIDTFILKTFNESVLPQLKDPKHLVSRLQQPQYDLAPNIIEDLLDRSNVL
jgi:UDP-N-acetyl-alpha-D-muramoyl-L-alanyl-L-glutamate epimerase